MKIEQKKTRTVVEKVCRPENMTFLLNAKRIFVVMSKVTIKFVLGGVHKRNGFASERQKANQSNLRVFANDGLVLGVLPNVRASGIQLNRCSLSIFQRLHSQVLLEQALVIEM